MATVAQVLKYLVTIDDSASAPLAKITTAWGKFSAGIHRAEATLAPLANRLTAITGAFVSLAAVRKAIELADFQIRQQVKLQVALGENVHLFEDQLKAASDFQSATLFTDEVTLSVRAMAFSFGIANAEMDDFIRAASTLAALGLVPSIEAAARQLLFLRSGQGQPLSVISRLPGVKEIPEAEKQAGGVEKMINRLLGSVAEEVAKTPFGTLQQDINLINDEFERLGRVLILIIGPAINRFKNAFSGFVDRAEQFLAPMAPIINAILVPIEGILRKLIAIAAVLTVIAISSKAIEFVAGGLGIFALALGKITGPLGGRLKSLFNVILGVLFKIGRILPIIAQLLLIGFLPVEFVLGVIIAIGAALALIVLKVKPIREAFLGLLVSVGAFLTAGGRIVKEVLSPVAKWTEEILQDLNDWIVAQSESNTAFGRTVKWLRDVNQGIKDGSKTFEDVADEAYLKLAPFLRWWVKLKFFALEVIDAIKSGFEAMWEFVKMAGNGILLALVGTLNLAIRGVAEAIDGILNAVAELVDLFDEDLAKSIRDIELGGAFENTTLGQLDNELLDAAIKGAEKLEQIAEERLATQERLKKEREEELALIDEKIKKDKEEIPRLIAERHRLRAAEAEAARRATEERLAALREVRLESERVLTQRLLSMAAARVLEEGQLQVAIQEQTDKELLELADRLQTKRLSTTMAGMEDIEKHMLEVLKAREDLELAQIEQKFKEEKASLDELFEARNKLSTASLERDIKYAKKEREIRLQAAEREFASREQHEKILREYGVEGQDLINRLREDEQNLLETMAAQEVAMIADTNDLRTVGLEQMAQMMEEQYELQKQQQEERLAFIRDALAIESNGVRNLTQVLEQAEKIQKDITLKNIELQQKKLDLVIKEFEIRKKQAKFLEELEVRRLRSSGDDFTADLAEAAQKTRESIAEFRQLFGREPGADVLQVFAAEEMQARLAAMLRETRSVLDQVSEAETSYAKSVQRRSNEIDLGLISQQQAREQTLEQIEALEAQTVAQIENLEALRDMNAFWASIDPSLVGEDFEETQKAIGLGIETLKNKLLEFRGVAQGMSLDFWGGVKRGLQDFAGETELTFARARELANELATVVGDELTNAFISVADHTASWSEAFREALRQILLSIARAIIQMLIFRSIASVLGVTGVLQAGGAAAAIPGRNSGGFLPGNVNGPNRDSAIFAGTPGEYVLERDASQYYGGHILNMLNDKQIPREVFGRIKGSSQTHVGNRLNGGGTVGREPLNAGMVMPATEDTMSTLIAGGRGPLIDFMRDNRDVAFGDDFARS